MTPISFRTVYFQLESCSPAAFNILPATTSSKHLRYKLCVPVHHIASDFPLIFAGLYYVLQLHGLKQTFRFCPARLDLTTENAYSHCLRMPTHILAYPSPFDRSTFRQGRFSSLLFSRMQNNRMQNDEVLNCKRAQCLHPLSWIKHQISYDRVTQFRIFIRISDVIQCVQPIVSFVLKHLAHPPPQRCLIFTLNLFCSCGKSGFLWFSMIWAT